MHLAALAPSWRPRPLAGGALLSLLVHALAIGAIGWVAARPAAPVAQGVAERITTLWLMREPAAPAAAAPKATLVAPARPKREAPHARAAAPAPAAVPAPHATQHATGPVHGIAFAVPTLGVSPAQTLGGRRAPSAAAASMSMPMPQAPPPQWLMQGAQQAALAQIGYQLQQRLAAVTVPAGTEEGHCRLASDDLTALACDSAALQASMAADAPALAGLLRAYRGLAPQLDHVALAYEQQRLRLDAR